MKTSSARPTRPGIQRLLGDGSIEDVAADVGRPNDCAPGLDGLLWYTAPAGDPYDEAGPAGSLRTWDPISGISRVRAEGLKFPNGVILDPNCAELYVAETAGRRVSRYAFAADGRPELVGNFPLPSGHPDGITLDAFGRLYVAAPSADIVFVFEPSGGLIRSIALNGCYPTSVAFAGAESEFLIVTAARGGRVLCIPSEEFLA